jgi:hypothetical protein
MSSASMATRPGRPAAGGGHWLTSGAMAGATSAFLFTIIHAIFITGIWSMLAFLLLAGALCGACLGWCYSLMVRRPSLKSWLAYNLLFDAMLVLLGLTSVLIFKPVTTMAELIALNGPPEALISQALPMTAVFTLIMAAIISLIYGFTWSRLGAALLTSATLVSLLGLNVSVIGLVAIPRGSWYLVGEMLALILVLNAALVIVFATLERRQLSPLEPSNELETASNEG